MKCCMQCVPVFIRAPVGQLHLVRKALGSINGFITYRYIFILVIFSPSPAVRFLVLATIWSTGRSTRMKDKLRSKNQEDVGAMDKEGGSSKTRSLHYETLGRWMTTGTIKATAYNTALQDG